MHKHNSFRREVLVFRRFGRKGYCIFASLGREVVIGTLSVFTLTHARADGVSIKPLPSDTVAAACGLEVRLGDVSVTGSMAPPASGRTVRMVSVLTQADIESAPAQSVNDLLKLAAGVDVRQRGPLGAQADVSIRGGNYEQVAVLLDGINICDPQTGHNAFDFPVDISEIERIEVLEGPAYRVYGTSSLSGAINIVTKRPSRTAIGATAEGGSFGYAAASARAAMASGAWSNSISVGYARSDGHSRNRAGRLNADYSGLKAFYRGGCASPALKADWHAGVSLKGYGANTFYGAQWDDQYERTFKSFTALRASARVGAVSLRSRLYWNHSSDRFELYRGTEEGAPFNYHRSDVFGLGADGFFDWALGRTAIGAELRNEDLVSTTLGEELPRPRPIRGTGRSYLYGLNRTNVSLTLEHNVSIGRLDVSAGLVAAKNSWADMPLSVYPGIDASLGLGRGWTVYASYNTSLRMPSATELYYSMGGHKADSHLAPEELAAAEAGVRYAKGGVRAAASLCHNSYKNLIDWVRDTAGGPDEPWRSVNFTSIDAVCVQASASLDFGRLLPAQRTLRSIAVDYAYTSQQKAGTGGLESKYSLEYLRHKLVGRLGLNLRRGLTLDVSCRWQDRTGTYTDTGGRTRPYTAYAVVDARIAQAVGCLKLFAEANNISNHAFVDYGNVPQPGFWFVGGLAIELD